MFTPHIKQPIRSNPTINANHISGAVPLRSKSIDFPVWKQRWCLPVIESSDELDSLSDWTWGGLRFSIADARAARPAFERRDLADFSLPSSSLEPLCRNCVSFPPPPPLSSPSSSSDELELLLLSLERMSSTSLSMPERPKI